MNIDYVIVQAGGKGTRMEHLTSNKPKALVPVGNRPMIFHLFEKFPEKYFIIIADYKSDVLKKYLDAFATVKFLVVETHGKKGTCSGIRQALEFLPSDASFMLIWSDLVLPEKFEFPQEEGDYVGLSKTFSCRWQYKNSKFEEISSDEFGVAGLFLFQDKKALQTVPAEGEFVKWLKDSGKTFLSFGINQTKEYGLIKEWEKDFFVESNPGNRCRPFNKLTVQENAIIKEGIDQQGRDLAQREVNWYQYAQKINFQQIPEIYQFRPLTMSRINGKNVFEYDLPIEKKREVLKDIVTALRTLHSFGKTETDYFSIYEAYVGKTLKRLEKIRDLVPFADRIYIIVNGKKCPNIFFFKEELKSIFSGYRCKNFTFIHGDNTFSNILLDESLKPIMIDPRGYFGFTELFGDPAYDWAKLYYSIVGNYDKFNLKNFKLSILDDEVKLEIASNGWEELADEFLEMVSDEADEYKLNLLHAVIWLSLTTYAWEDYDSICGAFYNGIYYLEKVLQGDEI